MKTVFSIRGLVASGLVLSLCAFAASSANAQVIVDDSFDDGAIGTNTTGTGTGFNQTTQSTGSSITEAGGSAVLVSGNNGGARSRINSIESTDTTTVLGASYLFANVLFGLAADDGGDGATFRQAMGVAQGNGAHAVDNLAEGFFVAFANDFYTAGGTLVNDNSFFFHQDGGGTRTTLATWDFDTLAFADGPPGTVTANAMNVNIALDAANWSLNITGDTQGGGSAVSFSGTHAGSGIANGVTAGSAYAGIQTESPNTQVSIGRVVITAVPEPSSLALIGLGSIGMLVRRKRR